MAEFFTDVFTVAAGVGVWHLVALIVRAIMTAILAEPDDL